MSGTQTHMLPVCTERGVIPGVFPTLLPTADYLVQLCAVNLKLEDTNSGEGRAGRVGKQAGQKWLSPAETQHFKLSLLEFYKL